MVSKCIEGQLILEGGVGLFVGLRVVHRTVRE